MGRTTFAFAILGLTAIGCGSATTVRAPLIRPAEVPVRAFPRILVTATPTDEAGRLARAIAQHLAGDGRSEVRRLRPERLDALRARGEITLATVHIHVRASLTTRDEAAWARRSVLDCGPLGCIERQRPYVRDLPVVRCEAELVVRDALTERELQRQRLVEEEAATDELAARLRVFDRVRARAEALVDQRTELVPVTLYPVDRPEVARAIDAAQRGRWAEARTLLEAFVGTQAWSQLSAEDRARTSYDLGQAQRFDDTLDFTERFSAAARSLRTAIRLHPVARYDRAIRELDAHRRARTMVQRQHEATIRNFALRDHPALAAIPEPPASYRSER